MKITELDLQTNGKRYKCDNTIFKVKYGDLLDVETNTYLKDLRTPIADLLEMEFEEVKEAAFNNPYKQVGCEADYYCIVNGKCVKIYNMNDDTDNEQLNIANYFNNKNYTEYIAFKENVMRKLDRFAWEHNAKAINWHNDSKKYFIAFDHKYNELTIDVSFAYQSNNIYFTSQEIAEKAIEEFKDDLMKLYTWEFNF